MNVTLTLDDELVEKVNKIAAEKETTLAGLVNEYLAKVAEENSEIKRLQRERLHDTFRKYSVKMGKRTWTRDDLYDRS
jgi:hypothetical protein